MEHTHLQKKLKNRHIQMIALGGAIGTGFFLGSASSIQMTGPSISLVYLLGGFIVYVVMRALGEMTVDRPTSGAFMEYASENLGKGVGFVAGWNTWMLFTVVLMLEVVAAATLLDFWIYIPHWITALVLLSIFMGLNLLGVKFFGEIEFWFAGIKIAVIIFMIIVGGYLIFADPIIHATALANIKEYQKPEIFFSHGMDGALGALSIAVLSFGGAEFISIAAGEAENPRKSIPQAVNGVVSRIIIFYVVTISIVILMYPYSNITGKTNPFTDVFTKIGFHNAAAIINFVAITATLSSLNSCLYVATRFLYSLANDKQAPKKFIKLNSNSVPARAAIFSTVIAFSVVIANYFVPAQIMNYLFSIISVAFIINWMIILISQLAFRKRKLEAGESLEYRMWGYPYINIIIMGLLFIVIIGMTKSEDMALGVYLLPIWLSILAIAYRISKNKEFIK